MSKQEILVKPFEERRYKNHRKKVITAAPAIDNETPAERDHVTVKLKKMLSENHRKDIIQRENFRLLQELGRIMQINRLDNWNERAIMSKKRNSKKTK